jgi:hypothetical protein
MSGTAVVVGVSTNSNLGLVREVAGAASRLALQTQPSATAAAGVPFAQQPVLQVRDQFGNLRSAANGVSDSTVVTATRGVGSGSLQGTLSATASDGVATFSNLSHNVATNITLTFSATGLTAPTRHHRRQPGGRRSPVFVTQPTNLWRALRHNRFITAIRLERFRGRPGQQECKGDAHFGHRPAAGHDDAGHRRQRGQWGDRIHRLARRLRGHRQTVDGQRRRLK